MGIIFSNAALMAHARLKGVSYDSILTIGHQTLYLSADQIERLGARFGVTMNPSQFADQPYADKFLQQFLGANSVTSLDYSDYEQCDIIHDLNRPLDPKYHEQFDVVIDGGSLEHIFNVPVAIANYMNLVKTGGSLFLFTMANNHMGHGFYQFSPELFFRIFQPENGFEIRDVILELHHYPGAELSRRTRCYRVVDPAALKSRVGLVSKFPVMMMVHAVKLASKPLFETFPIQSDYASIYAADSSGQTNSPARRSLLRKCLSTIYRSLPAPMRNAANGYLQLRHYSIHNRQFYSPWEPV